MTFLAIIGYKRSMFIDGLISLGLLMLGKYENAKGNVRDVKRGEFSSRTG